MKLSEIKTNIASILGIADDMLNAAYIKRHHSNLVTQDMNLRTKDAWMRIYESLCQSDVDETLLDVSEADVDFVNSLLTISTSDESTDTGLDMISGTVDSTAIVCYGEVAPNTLGTNTTNKNKQKQQKLMSVNKDQYRLTQTDVLMPHQVDFIIQNYPLQGIAMDRMDQTILDMHQEKQLSLALLAIETEKQQTTIDISKDISFSYELDETETFLALACLPFLIAISCSLYGVLGTVLFCVGVLMVTVPEFAKVVNRVSDLGISLVDYTLKFQHHIMRVINAGLLKLILSLT